MNFRIEQFPCVDQEKIAQDARNIQVKLERLICAMAPLNLFNDSPAIAIAKELRRDLNEFLSEISERSARVHYGLINLKKMIEEEESGE